MDTQAARAWLLAARNTDGSWGYLPGQTGRGEPTLLCVIGGLEAPLSWLEKSPRDWSWLLLPAALAPQAAAGALVTEAREAILGRTGKTVDAGDALGHDTGIPAWPWVEGTAPWVEPTSFALCSLRRMKMQDHPRYVDGCRMLGDRQCADGGWNYGNPEVLGAVLESYLDPTGWAVMALPAGPAVERALERLLEARNQSSTLTLSLAILARGLHGAPLLDLPERLGARQAADGSFGGRVDRTALALAALEHAAGGVHPLGNLP